MLTFLCSEDSLCTFANYQELVDIANKLNIRVHVFTYGINVEPRQVGMEDSAHEP